MKNILYFSVIVIIESLFLTKATLSREIYVTA